MISEMDIFRSMTNYSIDTGHGTQLTTGLQGYDHAREVAQRLANERGESVFLYAAGRVDSINEETGEAEVATEEIAPSTVQCECGAWSGEQCGHRAVDLADTVIVEFMPEQYRAGHGAARNRGSYPGNGAKRIRVATDCADDMFSSDGDWCSLVEAP